MAGFRLFSDSLEYITVDNDNKVYDSRDNCNAIIETSTNKLISGCKNTKIPKSVTSIGSSAFYECRTLTKIEIPGNVKVIEDYAFNVCTGLKSVIINEGTTEIGKSAFDWCTDLTEIQIPKSVTTIGKYAFLGINSSATINYTGTEEQWAVISSGHELDLEGITINCNYIPKQ